MGPRRPEVPVRLLMTVVVAATMLASGCLYGTAEVRIEADDSGSVLVELEPPRSVAAQLDAADLERLAREFIGGEVVVARVEASGSVQYRLGAEFDDHRSPYSGPAAGLLPAFEISTLDDGGWTLDAEIPPLRSLVDLGAAVIGDLTPPPDRRPMLRLTVALPGKVNSTNADEFDGGSATWIINSLDEPTRLRMRTVPDPFLTPPVLAAAVGVGVLLLGALFLFAARVRSPGGSTSRGRWGRRGHRSHGSGSRRSWSDPAVDEHAADGPVATVPLEWQAWKPTPEQAAAARLELPAPSAQEPPPASGTRSPPAPPPGGKTGSTDAAGGGSRAHAARPVASELSRNGSEERTACASARYSRRSVGSVAMS